MSDTDRADLLVLALLAEEAGQYDVAHDYRQEAEQDHQPQHVAGERCDNEQCT